LILAPLVLLVWGSFAWAGQGWYLLLPPKSSCPPEKICAEWDTNAPLSQWEHVRASDSAQECELTRIDGYEQALQRATRLQKNTANAVKEAQSANDREKLTTLRRMQMEGMNAMTQYGNSRCIASDDPRLK